jgi:hypothetical protein
MNSCEILGKRNTQYVGTVPYSTSVYYAPKDENPNAPFHYP